MVEDELSVYVSLEASEPELCESLASKFPGIDISKSRHLLGVGEMISIVLSGIASSIAVLEYVGSRKAAVKEVRITRNRRRDTIVIQVQDKNVDEIIRDITRQLQSPGR